MFSAISNVAASVTVFFPHLKIPGGRDKARNVSKGRGTFIREGAFVREGRLIKTCQLRGALIR